MRNEAEEFDKDLGEALKKRAKNIKEIGKDTIVHGDSKIGDLKAPNIEI
jgi:phage-related tail protein